MRISGRNIFLGIGAAILLAACVEDDPRYPVYYHYAVDVKVDGQPVRIERVIKCTGTLVTGSTYAPGVTTGSTFVSPPLMGAYVPGTSQAVYTPVVGACRWASASPEEREENSKKLRRVLDQSFTEVNKYLPPNAKMPLLWVSDDQTFDEMEYYASARALSGVDSHVEFIKAHPPQIVDEVAFEESEESAKSKSPDLTPFFLPEDRRLAFETKIYKERFKEDYNGLVFPFCYAAWRIPRSEWSLVPELEDWVADLPNDGRAYLISEDLWGPFDDTIVGIQKRASIYPVKSAQDDKSNEVNSFASYNLVYPVIGSNDGSYIDLKQQGFFGCEYSMIQSGRSEADQRFRIDRSTKPSPSFLIEPAVDRLSGRFLLHGPVYVRELDEFIVFINLTVGGQTTGEPVARGWKE
jgi:hypothetical protein